MLSKKDLLSIGYTFHISDFKRPYFVTPDKRGSEDYDSEKDAIVNAAQDAVENCVLSRCDNCGKVHLEENLAEAKHLSMRTEPGGTIPSGECPDCGALCYPLKDDELAELAPANHDTSVMVGVIHGIDWTILSKQKLALVELVHSNTSSHQQKKALRGIIHLLDAMQDAASDDGLTGQTLDQFQKADAVLVQQLSEMTDEQSARLVANAIARGYEGEDLGILVGVLNDQFPDHSISVFHEDDGNTAQSILMFERWCDAALQLRK